MAEVIPGFLHYDIEDLLKLICPRKLLIMSAEEDKYSQDAQEIYTSIREVYKESNATDAISLKHYKGGHRLDKKRFDFMVKWFAGEFKKIPSAT